MKKEFSYRYEEEQTELQQTIETIVGYFKVMGTLFLAVVFLILIFIPALSKM